MAKKLIVKKGKKSMKVSKKNLMAKEIGKIKKYQAKSGL